MHRRECRLIDTLIERGTAVIQIEYPNANDFGERLVGRNEVTSVDGKLIEIASFPVECLRSDQRVGETVRLNLEVGLGRVEQPIVEAHRRAGGVDHVDEGDETAGRFALGDLHGRVMRRLMEELWIANIQCDRIDGGNENQKQRGCHLHLEWRETTMFVCDAREERRETVLALSSSSLSLSRSIIDSFAQRERERMKNSETNKKEEEEGEWTGLFLTSSSYQHSTRKKDGRRETS